MKQTIVNFSMDTTLKKSMAHLHQAIAALNAGQSVEHELIENAGQKDAQTP